jgi:type 2 lantibiotic biosynthesis protein LanM
MLVADPQPLEVRQQGKGLARGLVAVSQLIQEAKERVRRGAQRLAASSAYLPFNPSTVDEILASPLDRQLLVMMARVLVLELNVARLEGLLVGDTPEERFGSFVHRLEDREVSDQLLSEYPVLAEQVCNRLDMWAAFSLEFLRHLSEDWTTLHQTFFSSDPGELVSIHGGAGDTHRQGRSVMIVSFADGTKLVYKPRCLAVEEHFQQLLLWLNDRGAQPRFQTMQILNRGSHGWSEFIHAKGCAGDGEVTRFYERQGGYLAVLYALNACDFHHENLIASGEHPFLIDLEALFHPRLDDLPEGSEESASAALGYSVLQIGLLPRRFGFTRDYDGVDLSGLSSVAGQLSPREVPHWDRANTDEMRLVRRRVHVPASQNTPKLDGQEVSAFDYADSITNGFCATYRLLLENRASLSAMLYHFANDEVRVIVRPTQSYGSLLYESFHPDLLRDHEERRALFERLQEGAEERPFLSRLAGAECRDLLRGDIPLFLTSPSSRDVWTSDGECQQDFLHEPPISVAQRRILELSDKDLERQIWIVQASIATLSPLPAHMSGSRTPVAPARLSNGSEGAPEEFLSAARAIGDRLEELALAENGGLNWIGVAYANEQHRILTPLGSDLYDGLPGMVLFLAYLGQVCGERRYSDLAKSALKTVQGQINANSGWTNIGGFAGLGGVVYSLVHAGVIFDDRSLLAEAEGLLDRIAGAISADNDLDIIAGSARMRARCQRSASRPAFTQRN